MHLRYLQQQYWRSTYSISFPRIRPFSGGFYPEYDFSDRQLLQLICAYRIFDHEIDLSLSTRESPEFRNQIVQLGVTSMSAESKTNPGGYVVEPESLKQFEISDERPTEEMIQVLADQGLQAVTKNWDRSLASHMNQ